MPASAQIITDLTTCVTTAPTAPSTVLANAAAGPIQDLTGNMEVALTKAQELKQLLATVKLATDASDPNYTRITDVITALA
jgi:hypothetical protein